MQDLNQFKNSSWQLLNNIGRCPSRALENVYFTDLGARRRSGFPFLGNGPMLQTASTPPPDKTADPNPRLDCPS